VDADHYPDCSRVAAITPQVLEDYKDMIRDATSDLQDYLQQLDKKVKSLASTEDTGSSTHTTVEWQAMLEEKESIHQCIQVVAEARKASVIVERRNVFEDITMADNSYDFSISTVGDLVTARRINLTGRSRHIGGQISDDSYQKTIAAIAQLDMGSSERLHTPSLDETLVTPELEKEKEKGKEKEREREKESGMGSGFGRYGPGNTLSSPAQDATILLKKPS